MSLEFFTRDLWLCGLVSQVALTCLLVYRHTWRRFPLFFTYCVFGFVSASGLYLANPRYGHELAYFFGFWSTEAIEFLLGFFVVYEVFDRLFVSHTALRRLAKASFFWALIVLVLLGCVVGWLGSSPQHSGIMAGILVTEEAIRIVEVGLLFFLFVFARAFGLHWRQSVFGIALGLAVYTAVELVATELRVKYGQGITPVFNVMRTSSFDLSLAAWIGYLLVPEKVAAPVELPSRTQLEQWNEAVKELIYQ